MTGIRSKSADKDALLPAFARLLKEHPTATNEELAKLLAAEGFLSRKGGGHYGTYSIYLMKKALKAGKKNG